jgi:competence protein ComEC
MKRPLSGLCIAFCLGIITAAYSKITFPVFYFLALSSLILSMVLLRQNLKFNIFILSVAFSLGATLLANSQILPGQHIAKIIPYRSDAVYLIGVIDSDPISKNAGVSFILRAEKLKTSAAWQKVCGRVLVRISKKSDFRYADRLLLKGKLYRPYTFAGGEFDYRDYLKHKGIYLILSVKKDGLIKQLDKSAGCLVQSFAFKIRQKMKDVILGNVSPFSASVLNAIILGERQNLPSYLRDSLVKTGSVHIIAISGLHLGIAAFIILVILKIARIPRKPRYVLTVFLLIFYCLLTGANTPALRATVMATVLLFGYVVEREPDIYNSLALAALIILAVNPGQLFAVSFQLSFLSVISIVWLSPKIKSLFPEKLQQARGLGFLLSVFSVSSAAWLGLAPLIAYYFKVFSPVTILANMIIVPYMTIIVAAGFSLGLVGILFSPLAPVFAAGTELLILILFKINSFLVAIPGAYFRLIKVSFILPLLYYALLAFIFNFCIARAKTRHETPC